MTNRTIQLLQLLTITVVLTGGCNPAQPVISDEEAYARSVAEWRQARLERLKGPEGWLNLAGLFWLEEGTNSFGSDPSNDIVFPEKADAFCGTLTLADGKVSLKVAEGVEILNENVPVTSLVLEDDQSGNATSLLQGDLSWYIIRRGDKYAVRLRDFQHPRIEGVDHIPAYPVNSDYVVTATLDRFSKPGTMTVATPVQGFTESYQCPGELHFRLNRKDLILYPFTSGESYFIVFADETTGVETYGAGRFMYALPDSTGRIILDFNRAYNPPCAFSPFATCPMPPRENFLPVSIKAGEKSVHFE
jgi:uncharacterized protein (DUF1684 family)